MAREFAERKKKHAFHRIPPGVLWTCIAAAVAVVAIWQTHSVLSLKRARMDDAKAWSISGPPCPTEPKETFLRPHQKGPKRVDYEDVTFFRRFGHTSCAPIYEDGGRGGRFHAVCQFTGPGELLIRSAKGEWAFAPGPGQPATISMQGGVAHCVMASKFTMASIMAGTAPR
ncbi:MAG TPA: hypothetical protein VFH92_02375 [Phenylobacterium sp.]|nr:hypothetical protein [Phenylobacterium sp.]